MNGEQMTDQAVANEPREPQPLNDGTEESEWFYVDKGTRTGPLTATAIARLLKKNAVDTDTQVWRKGLKEWVSLKDSELAVLMTTEPPPIAGEHIRNGIVWVVALLPLARGLFELYLAQLPDVDYLKGIEFGVVLFFPQREVPWWFVFLGNSALCIWDECRLTKAGHNTAWTTVSAIFLTPVYLFVRAKKLKQWPTYAVAWLLAFFVQIILLS